MVKFYTLQNIVVGEYDPAYTITVEMAQDVVRLRMEYLRSINLETAPTLCISNGIELTSSARKFFSSDAGYEGITRMAFLVNSQAEAFGINFYIWVTRKHKAPLKIFTKLEDAVKWLNVT